MFGGFETMRRDVFSVRYGDRPTVNNIAIVVMAGSDNVRPEEAQLQVGCITFLYTYPVSKVC